MTRAIWKIKQGLGATAGAVLLLALLCSGCGGSPQFAVKDQRLLEALRTAVSTHKADWLEASAKKIDAAHQKGEISDEGFQALQSVNSQARAGDWKAAQVQIIQLEKGQRPPEK